MFIKNKKGFSLLEVLVTMGIVTVLAGIAIPAYNSYKEGVKDTAVKADISNARKAYLAHDAVNNTFCVSLSGAGLGGLGESDTYKKADDHFMGFDHPITGCTGVTLGVGDVQKKSGSNVGGASCDLTSSTFKLGGGFKKGSHSVGYNISNDSSGPVATGSGSCDGDASATTPQKTACQGHSGKSNCDNGTNCAWTANTTDICT